LLQIHTPTSWKAQQLCAECLGLLGAVDPARVVVALDPPESLCRSTKDLLIILIMRHLVRLLRVASHIFVLDAAALAIQVWRNFRRMGSCIDAVDCVAGRIGVHVSDIANSNKADAVMYRAP